MRRARWSSPWLALLSAMLLVPLAGALAWEVPKADPEQKGLTVQRLGEGQRVLIPGKGEPAEEVLRGAVFPPMLVGPIFSFSSDGRSLNVVGRTLPKWMQGASSSSLQYESWDLLTGRLLETRQLADASRCEYPIEVSSRRKVLCHVRGRAELLVPGRLTPPIVLEGSPVDLREAVFSADGGVLAAYTWLGEVFIWSAETGRSLHRFTLSLDLNKSSSVDSIHLSTDGASLFVSWHEEDKFFGEYLRLPSGAKQQLSLPGAIADVRFGSDGLPQAIVKANAKLSLWSLKDDQGHSEVRELKVQEDRLHRFDPLLTPDGKLIIARSDGYLRAVDAELETELWRIPRTWGEVRFSHDSRFLAFSDASQIQLVDVASGMVRTLSEFRVASSVDLSGDGSMLMVASMGQESFGADTFQVQSWNLDSGALAYAYTLEGIGGGYTFLNVRMSRDGTALVAEGSRGSVRWSAWSEQQQQWQKPAGSIAISPSGRLSAEKRDESVVVMGADGQPLWKAAAGNLKSLAFSPDESKVYMLAKGGSSLSSRVSEWDVATGREVRAVEIASADETRLMAGPHGYFLLLKFEAMSGWVPELFSPTGKRIWAGPALGLFNNCLTFTPDGKSLLVDAYSAQLVELQTQVTRELKDISGEGLNSCGFSADGKRLALGYREGGVQVVDWPSRKPVALVRAGENWLLRKGDRLFRADDGQGLYREGAGGHLEPVAPAPDPRGPPKLEVSVTPESSPGEGRETGTLTVHVKNAGQGTAWWVAVEPKGLQDGVTILPPDPLARLEPGEARDIPVKLSAANPAGPVPREISLELEVHHAHGVVPLRAEIALRAPRIELAQVRTQGDSDNAVSEILLENTGTQASGLLRLTAQFLRDGVEVGKQTSILDPIPSLVPSKKAQGEDAPHNYRATISLPEEIRESSADFHVKLTVRGELWPTHRWELLSPPQHVGVRLGTTLAIALGALGLLLSGSAIFALRLPKTLRGQSLAQMKALDRLLRRMGGLNLFLTRDRIPRSRWDRAVDAAYGSEEAAKAFVDAVGARLGAAIPGIEKAWDLQLPQLQVRFENATALLVFEGRDLDEDRMKAIAEGIYRDGKGPGHAIVLDLTDNQRVAEPAKKAERFDFIILNAIVLPDLLLSDDPLLRLEQCIAEQRHESRAVYQTAGGLNDSRRFFGRKRELKTVLGSGLRNFVVVAARQSGKSSFLKELERRMAERSDLEAFYVSHGHTNLADAIADALKQLRPADDLGFRKLAQGSRERPRVWLVDETDEFVEADRKRGFQQTAVMRELAEAGQAYFILAGSWQLYRAVYFDPLNPLRNFAERIDLGPLDAEAARELATRPLQVLGVSFDSPETVEYLLEQTGRRPNLVAITCNEMVNRLGPTDRILTRARLDEVFEKSVDLLNALTYYRLSPPWDRAVLRAALLVGERSTRAEIRERLEAAGGSPKADELDRCLENLQLAYLLMPEGGEAFRCPVPLLYRMFERDSEREQRLRDDIEEAEERLEQQAEPPRAASRS